MSEAIKVVVRIRPMNTKQKERNCTSIVKYNQQNTQLSIQNPSQPDNVKSFAFDSIFNEESHQQTVYSKTAYNLVENVLTGYNGTIFAYGQTGCGKTHSMVGKVDDEDLQGIIPRSFGHILKTISETKDKQFLIRCSFIQIYNEEVRDLLAKDVKNKLEIKQSPDKGVFIKDLSINTAKTHDELMDYMNTGNKSRSVGETAMNKDSSRSHLLFALYLESAEMVQNEDPKYIASKLNLVDLAGSQRISKTGVSGDRLKQAQKINLSLSALGNVISALVDGKSQHIPYRDSKLTRLLQDSLGGNTKTVMIANCSPADYNFDETLSTLRYASRAKFIKNKPIINQDPKDALLKQYASQIKKLKMMLSNQGGGENINMQALSQAQSNKINEKLRQKQQELTNQKEQKRQLQDKIRQLQNRHVEGKDIHIDSHVVSEMNKAKSEFKMEEQRRISLKNMVKTGELDEEYFKNIENTSSAAEKAQKYKYLVKKLKNKVKSLQQQLKDINHQNYIDKEQNLEDIRVLSKQNKLLEGIMNIILHPSELDTVRGQCQFNEDSGEYKVPPFYMKTRQVFFPKLGENQSMDMIRKMQEDRVITFEQNLQQQKSPTKINNRERDENTKPMGTPIGHSSSGKGLTKQDSVQYSVNEIIKGARSQNKLITIKDDKKANRKIQLQPIRKE